MTVALPRLVLLLLLAGLAIVLAAPAPDAANQAGPAAPAPPTGLDVTVQDDALLLHRPPAKVRATLRRLAALGTDWVRITAGWSVLAPDPGTRRRPRFDAADPRSYRTDQMRRLDVAVREARRAGLRVQLDLAFWAPRWAVRRGVPQRERQRWAPDAREFGRFATAMARRYSGRFRGLPAVRLWTTWNEPNHPVFLLPQWQRTAGGGWRPSSPHVYRRLHESAYRALKRESARNRVLIGGLSAKGGRRRAADSGVAPMRFTRELACVDEALQPLRVPECRGFRALRADGFAHHPYSFDRAPDVRSAVPGEVPLADVDRLGALLGALHARGRLAQPLELYLTEYGYETRPDPFRGISPGRQARYHGQATYVAWRTPGVRMFAQFLLRDVGPRLRFPPGSRARWRDYQTGLVDHRGRDKPAVRAFRLPFWAQRTPEGGVLLFAQVRPGSGRRALVVQRRAPGGAWVSQGPVRRTDASGVHHEIRPGAPAGAYRAVWLRGGRRSPVASVAVWVR